MTDARNTSIAHTQIGLLVRYVLRTRWAIPTALIAAIVAAGATELYRRATQSTTYVSETVAVVRPQAAFKLNARADVINYLNNPDKEAEFLPEPLSVVDYELLIKTQDVLEAVAARYNEQHGADAVTANALRGYLQPITKLELRTPYEVRYYPTMQLRVQAPTPEMAHGLATIWAEESEEFCRELTQNVKQETVDYVRRQYDATLETLQTEGAPAEMPHVLQMRLNLLSTVLTQAELALANETPEFKAVSKPTPAVAQRRGWPTWASIVAFVVVFAVVAAAGLLWTIVADVRRALTEETQKT